MLKKYQNCANTLIKTGVQKKFNSGIKTKIITRKNVY